MIQADACAISIARKPNDTLRATRRDKALLFQFEGHSDGQIPEDLFHPASSVEVAANLVEHDKVVEPCSSGN